MSQIRFEVCAGDAGAPGQRDWPAGVRENVRLDGWSASIWTGRSRLIIIDADFGDQGSYESAPRDLQDANHCADLNHVDLETYCTIHICSDIF